MRGPGPEVGRGFYGAERMLDTEIAIAGFGDSYADENDVKTPLELAVEASVAAIEDASLEMDDVDSLLTGRPPFANRGIGGPRRSETGVQWSNVLSTHLGIPTRHNTMITIHGAGANATLKHAWAAINSGFADTVLCVQSDAAGLFVNGVADIPKGDAELAFEYPYGPIMPSLYALLARRHMHEYGTTHEQMARVAVEHRKWGSRHPEAWAHGRGEITVQDVRDSRPIAEPLHLLDCAPLAGGVGNAMLVTEADRAERLQDDPVYVRGVGEYNTHEKTIDKLALRGKPPNEDGPNLTTTGVKQASQQAYEMAGMGPDDMDLVETFTNFTHIGLILLEDLGFCEKGQAGEFVENGGIDFDGGLPFNTFGGLISFGQTAQAGMDMLTETVRQLRGEALGVQVPDAETGLAHGMGAALAGCSSIAILSTERGDA